ncbi:MAG: F0F1 ATP synthase subunit A [Verrucomicrobiota bacterium]
MAAAKGDGPPLTPYAQEVFTVFGLSVTNSMIASLILAVFLALMAWLSTRKIQMVPSGLQNFVEFVVESLENVMSDLLEPRVVRWVFPFIATFFIFILAANLSALIPGVGSIGYISSPSDQTFLGIPLGYVDLPLYRPPTADANMTAAMATIFFFACWYWTFKYNGFVGTIAHIFAPKGGFKGLAWAGLLPIFIFIGVLELISILIRPVALAARLYGNIFGGENVLTIMLTLNSSDAWSFWGAVLLNCLSAFPFYFLELLVATVQTLVFTLLCLAFTTSLCSHVGGDDHDDHGKEASAA